MKVVILAGGRGTRLRGGDSVIPKPMLEIGGRPILWHIMHIYARHGHTDFLIACGFKGEIIKEYFGNFALRNCDYLVNLGDGTTEIIGNSLVNWCVGVIDTGLDTETGGRLRRLRPWLDGETFLATYGDGVGDIDIGAMLDFHRAHGKLATVTAVHPPARFGNLSIREGRVHEFREKPQAAGGWINGGFFAFEPGVLNYIDGDEVCLEREPLERLARDEELMAYCHTGFWQPMDTAREKELLEALWAGGDAPWRG